MKDREEIIAALIKSNLVYENGGNYYVGLNGDSNVNSVVDKIVEELTRED